MDLLNLRRELLVFLLKIFYFFPNGFFDIVPAFFFHSCLFFVFQNYLLVFVVFMLIILNLVPILIIFNLCILHLFGQNLIPSFFTPVELIQILVGQLARE